MVWGKYLGIAMLPAEKLALGFVVSKKTMPRAVDRNRFKRLVYQIAKDLDLIVNEEKIWIVFIAKSAALKVKLTELQNEINGIMDTKSL